MSSDLARDLRSSCDTARAPRDARRPRVPSGSLVQPWRGADVPITPPAGDAGVKKAYYPLSLRGLPLPASQLQLQAQTPPVALGTGSPATRDPEPSAAASVPFEPPASTPGVPGGHAPPHAQWAVVLCLWRATCVRARGLLAEARRPEPARLGGTAQRGPTTPMCCPTNACVRVAESFTPSGPCVWRWATLRCGGAVYGVTATDSRA
ncbi:hypothetical protein DENSPDRAFT_880676 [Dentipellis sp. KUC8613]|nr:hypothetical protein DENSPDRAFT_880676 [Dentipellis sp. KUC8613]